jgi:hypothetical protein
LSSDQIFNTIFDISTEPMHQIFNTNSTEVETYKIKSNTRKNVSLTTIFIGL